MVYIKGGEDYPGYNFDEADPIRLGDVVTERHGMPLFRRSMSEIDEDVDMAMRAEEHLERSIARRGPKRYKSRFVVEYLDNLDARFNQIGSLAINHVRFLAAKEGKV